jgi:hypothetical protein
MIIINNNSYVIDDKDLLDNKEYLGSIIILKGYRCFIWKDNHYLLIINLNPFCLIEKEKILIVNNKNLLKEKIFPIETEIILYWLYYYEKNFDLAQFVNLKIFVFLGNLSNAQLNLPLGLKKIFLSKSETENSIGKIKIPFGCELILI